MPDTAKIQDHIGRTQFVEIITNGLDGFPNTRIFGHYANDGYDVYLSTAKGSRKTEEIGANSNATAHYRVDGQAVPQYFSVTIYGNAELLVRDSDDFKRAISLISARSPSFREKLEKQGLESTALYRLKGERVKVLDFAQGRGPAAIEEFKA
jgi:nitroimidazol reductase NimA-like FMN-containing flavoprotein (pyridoxamine 5'-phosphate oxidase superfamily)